MSKFFVIPNELIFSPCKVDGNYWKDFHILISYLGNPEELVKLKNENYDQYAYIVDTLVTFVKETEKELFEKGYITESNLDLEENN